MKVIIEKAKIKDVKTKFKWGDKANRIGYQVVLTTKYYNKENPEEKYNDVYVMVFKTEIIDLIDQYLGQNVEFTFEANLNFKRIKSKRYVNVDTQEPALIPSWDFSLSGVIDMNKNPMSREHDSFDSLPTLEDVLEE